MDHPVSLHPTFVLVTRWRHSSKLTILTRRYYHSSSCASRSGIACYQVAHKFNFTTDWLVSNQTNEMILSLPFNASGISVLYDAIRLEVE